VGIANVANWGNAAASHAASTFGHSSRGEVTPFRGDRQEQTAGIGGGPSILWTSRGCALTCGRDRLALR
jgi:hypothetical protein